MGWALKEGVKGIFVIGKWPNFFSRNVKRLVFTFTCYCWLLLVVLSISFERFFPYREGAHLFSLKVNTSTWL